MKLKTVLVFGLVLGLTCGAFVSAFKVGTDGTGQRWGWINNDDGLITTSAGKAYPCTDAGLKNAAYSLNTTGGTVYGNGLSITLSSVVNISHNNISLQDIKLYGTGGIRIYAAGKIENITLKNIYLQITTATVPCVYFYAQSTGVFENIMIDNVFADGGDYAGIWFDGLTPCKTINATIRNCRVFNADVDGFFLGTYNNTNVLYDNCISSYADDCGFSNEFDHINNNVRYVSCVASHCGKAGVSAYYKTGFLLGHGVSVIGCSTDNCLGYGFLTGNDATRHDQNITTFTDCRDNHSRVSMYIAHSATIGVDGAVQVNGFVSRNSTDEAFRVIGTFIHVNNMLIIQPGYNKTFKASVLLGGLSTDAVVRSEFHISVNSLVTSNGNTSIRINNGEKTIVSAFIDQDVNYPIQASGASDLTLDDIYIDSDCDTAIRFYGSNTGSIVRNVIIADNSVGSITTGIDSTSGVSIYADSVIIKDATTKYSSTSVLTYETSSLITNSNGHYFMATQSCLQSAIYDLNSTNGGWVEIPYSNNLNTSSVKNLYNVSLINMSSLSNIGGYDYYIKKQGKNYFAYNGTRLIKTSINASSVIQYAINTVPHDANGGARFYFSRGVFEINTALSIPSTCTAIYWQGASATFMDEGTVLKATATISQILYSQGNFFGCSDIFFNGDNKCTQTLRLANYDVYLNRVSIGYGTTGLYSSACNLEITNCWIEYNSNIGLKVYISTDVWIDKTIFYNNQQYDIQLLGYTAINSSHIWITNNRFTDTDNGIYISPANSNIKEVFINNNVFYCVGYTASAATVHDNVIYMTGKNCSDINIKDNFVVGGRGGTMYTADFIEFVTGGDYNRTGITGNNIKNISGSVINGGSYARNTLVDNNIGYKTESYGSATIPNNAYSVNVSHNLSSTAKWVIITFHTLPNAGIMNVSVSPGGSATQFKVTTSLKTTYAEEFYWYAKC